MSLANVSRQLADLIFPPRCQVCGELRDSPFCETCRGEVEFIAEPLCTCCGVPFEPAIRRPQLCSECQTGRYFTGARAVGLYTGPMRDAILRYKFHGRRLLGPVFGGMLADLALAGGPGGLPFAAADAIVPVPLHSRRLAWRGFDQASLLCQPLAEGLGLPVWDDVLERTRDTTPQVQVRGRKRLQNVRGAFEARKTWRLGGRSVILVDDVFTTGATIIECARTLRKAGVADVYALTVARVAPVWHPASFRGAGDPDGLWGDE